MKRLIFSLVIAGIIYYPTATLASLNTKAFSILPNRQPTVTASTGLLRVVSSPALPVTRQAVTVVAQASCGLVQQTNATYIQDQAQLNLNSPGQCFSLAIATQFRPQDLTVTMRAPFRGSLVVHTPTTSAQHLDMTTVPNQTSQPFLPQPLQLGIFSGILMFVATKRKKITDASRQIIASIATTQLQVMRC